MPPAPDRSEFDSYADGYERSVERAISFSRQNHDFYLRAKSEYLVDALHRAGVHPNRCSLLDVGCGNGALHAHLQAFTSVIGVDESSEMLARAAVGHPTVCYVRSNGRPLPFADEHFDVVLAVNLFHHVRPEQRPALVREMERVCRARGFVAVIEHNPLHPLTRYVVHRCPCDHDARLLGGGETARLLEDTRALYDIDVGYILVAPSENRLVRRLERLARRIPVGAQYCAIGRKRSRRA